MTLSKIQLGKNKVTENFIETLKSHFKRNNVVKISVLKSAGRESLKSYSEEILEELGAKYTSKIIGFTIVLKKWRRDKR